MHLFRILSNEAAGEAPTGAGATPAQPVLTPPAAAPAAPPGPATVTAKSDEPQVGDPGWLKNRIERAAEKAKKEERKVLKNERKALKSAASEAKALSENAQAELAAAKTAVDAFLRDVPEADRAIIEKAGSGSVVKTLEAFNIWKAARVGAPAPVAAAPSAGAQALSGAAAVGQSAPLAPPASTTPAGTAPAAPSGTLAPDDHKAVYESLRGANPYLASQYLLNFREQIYPGLALKK